MLKIAISIETTMKPMTRPMIRIMAGSRKLTNRLMASRRLF